MGRGAIAAIIVGLVIVLAQSSYFIVTEQDQVVLERFGEPIATYRDAGFYVKNPIDTVHRLDKRVLNWDGAPDQIPTRDKKVIIVDTTARWRISDPIVFRKSFRGSEDLARNRLNAMIDAATREVISRHNLVEAVRSSDRIIEQTRDRAKARDEAQKAGKVLEGVDDEVTGEIENVTVGRDELSSLIAERARQSVEPNGITLIDVQLRRIAYEKSVETQVYERMKTERMRIAEKVRSIGEGEKVRIQGETERQLQEIDSTAYKQVQEILGKGQAKAMQIYADAIGPNAENYEFLRTLDAYKRGFTKDTRVVLSADSNFFRLLERSADESPRKRNE